jgi:hypothetical protein
VKSTIRSAYRKLLSCPIPIELQTGSFSDSDMARKNLLALAHPFILSETGKYRPSLKKFFLEIISGKLCYFLTSSTAVPTRQRKGSLFSSNKKTIGLVLMSRICRWIYATKSSLSTWAHSVIASRQAKTPVFSTSLEVYEVQLSVRSHRCVGERQSHLYPILHSPSLHLQLRPSFSCIWTHRPSFCTATQEHSESV